MRPTPGSTHDVIGVGFGPSNLALAVAIEEHNRAASRTGRRPLLSRFFEKQAEFGWHRGMLLEHATVQVSFLKDLVTLRNPASEFSFVAYLHDRGRLADFVNHKTLFPLRVEFNDYFAWAAERLGGVAHYGREATEIRPVVESGVVTGFDVTVRSPTKRVDVHRARNVVVAAGLVPALPDGVEATSRVWHNADLLSRLAAVPGGPGPRRFVVVGAGQSAAETTDYLCGRYPDAEVSAVFARFGYTPADDSPFANRIFDPASVDVFYAAPDGVKEMLAGYHRSTNYSVVDAELISALYRRSYAEQVLGRRRLRILHASRVVDLDERDGQVSVVVEFMPDGSRVRIDADVVIYATGYRPADPRRILGRTGPLCRRDGQGRLRISRDYRLDLTVPCRAGLFLTGASEHTHGLSDTLLSNIAVRAGEIVESISADLPMSGDTPAPPGTDEVEVDVASPRPPAVALDPPVRLAPQPSAREAS